LKTWGKSKTRRKTNDLGSIREGKNPERRLKTQKRKERNRGIVEETAKKCKEVKLDPPGRNPKKKKHVKNKRKGGERGAAQERRLEKKG